jgi:diguanylate cyclase (GGDEF)-like protein
MPDDSGTHAVATAATWTVEVLLDALPDSTAILDRDGTIVAVNRAWTLFALDNDGRPADTGVGVNYLDVCTRSAAAGCADAAAVATGLRAVLNGDTVESDLEYPCPSQTVSRWFALRVTSIPGPRPGLLVSHVNISRQKIAEQILERKASEDPLTGLANRALFNQRLTAAIDSRSSRAPNSDLGLLYLDLDAFKPVNDTYGHAAGDEVLQTVAVRLRQQTRPQDTVARLGGDEFAIIVPRITAAGLTGLVARIGTALQEPHLIHGDLVTVGASIGSYLAGPEDTLTRAMHSADEAMYAVKRGRREPVRPHPAAPG